MMTRLVVFGLFVTLAGCVEKYKGTIAARDVICIDEGEKFGHYYSACERFTQGLIEVNILGCFADGCIWKIDSGVVPYLNNFVNMSEVNVVCDKTLTSCKFELTASYKQGMPSLETAWESSGFLIRLLIVGLLIAVPLLGWVVACAIGPLSLAMICSWSLLYGIGTDYFVLTGVSGLKVG